MPGECIQEDEAALQTSESARTYNTRRGLRSTSADLSTLIQHSEVVHSKRRGLQNPRTTTSSSTTKMSYSSSAAITPEPSLSSSSSTNDTLPTAMSTLSLEEKSGQSASEVIDQKALLRRLQAKCHSPARLRTEGLITSPCPKSDSPQWKGIIRLDLFKRTPGPHHHHQHGKSGRRKARDAVVIDCEMVQAEKGRRVIAYLAAVDFITGEVLINSYVDPQRRIFNWCTHYSGITPKAMKKAVANGDALRGWMGARRALWDFIDNDTVLIGHDIKNDLNCLGIIHPRIVDSTILTAEAVFRPRWETQRFRRTWSLKTLSSVFLDRFIQGGANGHSALQDAVATKDVVVFCLEQPECLKIWAEFTRGGWDDLDDFETLKSLITDGVQVSDYL
ncbi:hypothetical protein AnigIFM56816_011403 [Aspergillus niger]|nr:hypothetical protein AnigIFM56816_011403 [Aspergillus niger]